MPLRKIRLPKGAPPPPAPPPAKETLGQRITRLREEKGLSKAELARRANTYPAEISRIESGVQDPRVKTAYRIAQALGVSLATLFEDVDVSL